MYYYNVCTDIQFVITKMRMSKWENINKVQRCARHLKKAELSFAKVPLFY